MLKSTWIFFDAIDFGEATFELLTKLPETVEFLSYDTLLKGGGG